MEEHVIYIMAGKAVAIVTLFGYIINVSRKVITKQDLEDEVSRVHKRIDKLEEEYKSADKHQSEGLHRDIERLRGDIGDLSTQVRELNSHLLAQKRQ